MFSRNKIHFEISERKVLLRIFDIASVLLALYLADVLFNFSYFHISLRNYYWTVVLGIYISVLGTVFEMYNLQVASNQFQVIRSIVLTSSTTVLFYLLTPIFTPILPLNRIQILYFYIAIFLSLLIWRMFYQKFLASYRFEKNVILICDNDQVKELVTVLENIDPHYKILGYFNTDGIENSEFNYLKKLSILDFEEFIKKNNISEIVIASQKAESISVDLYNQLLELLENGFIIREYAQVYEQFTQRIPIQHFNKDFYKYFPFSRNNQNKLYLLIIKITDTLMSTFGLVLCTFFIPIIVVGNAIGNQGKLFYKQTRVGKNGKSFEIFKFRTMIKNAEVDGAVFATLNDNRITPFGKFLRNTRLDEMPQFYNILKGEMAFIGPRPERPFFVNELSKSMPFYETRHIIKPGITGWAQVNYAYGETREDSLKKLQYDLYYIKHRSVFLDINIIIKTFSTVLFYRGQ